MRQGLLGGSAYSWCSTRSRCYRILSLCNWLKFYKSQRSNTKGYTPELRRSSLFFDFSVPFSFLAWFIFTKLYPVTYKEKSCNNDISLNTTNTLYLQVSLISCICFLFIVVNCELVYDLKMVKHGRNMSSSSNQKNTILRQLCFDGPTHPHSHKTQRGWETWRETTLNDTIVVS